MQRRQRWTAAVAVAAVGLVVLLALVVRLDDPLSSSVVPAEDPYNHMALVREHVRTGELEPLSAHQDLYPPGLHAVLAATWAYTGADLYNIVRLGPAFMGAVGVLGMALLLWRTVGPVAGFVGALALAVAPEAIFRTTMMSPTALDLAILPFFLLGLLRCAEGRLGWLAVAAPTAVFLAFAHPWLLAILCATGAGFLVLTALVPGTAPAGRPLSAAGIAACFAVLGAGLAIALATPGFEGIVSIPGDVGRDVLVWTTASLAIAAAAAAVLLRLGRFTVPMGWSQPADPGSWRGHLAVRLVTCTVLAAALLLTALAASSRGMPAFVDLPRMFGWPLLALAAAAFVALPFVTSPVARLMAALALATLPFVVFNPFTSEFLPHRTAVFLGVALAALAGIAAHVLARGIKALAIRLASATGKAQPSGAHASSHPSARRAWMAAAPALLVCTLLGGSIFAATPEAYPGGWYRLYTPCELDGLRDVAALADAEPDAILVTGDWQAKLVLAALAHDASRVWYKADLYTSSEVRDTFLGNMAKEGHPVIVVDDRYLQVETPSADTGFLDASPWRPAGAWCAGMGLPEPRLTAHITGTTEDGA